MPIQPCIAVRPFIAVAMVVASSLLAIAQQPPTPTRVRGTIEKIDGDVLSVKSRDGEDVKLRMTADMRLVGIIRISLADIKLGSFIGTTTVPGHGKICRLREDVDKNRRHAADNTGNCRKGQFWRRSTRRLDERHASLREQ
jgi:hypothetical protein